MEEIRRKIISSEGEVIKEYISKEYETKNILTHIITRKHIRAIVLSCGHKIPVTRFKKVPTNNTRCYRCEDLRDEANA